MHKKRIGNNYYFYTTIRDKEKTNSVYLGRNYKEAKIKENELKNTNKINITSFKISSFNAYNIFLVAIFMISLFCIVYFNLTYTAFVIITQFNNTNTAENLTLYQNITTNNITRYVSLNKYMNISSAYLNLSGFDEWINQSDGFDIKSAGSDNPGGITSNGSDFWVVDSSDLFVYHFNRTGSNMSDGFYIGGSGTLTGIDTNGSDFWITRNAGGPNSFIFHFNRTGSNMSDGFYIPIAIPYGLATNGSDFWVVNNDGSGLYHFVNHFNRTGSNMTDGFNVGSYGCDSGTDIKTNGSDFWVIDNLDKFVYHFNRTGSNMSDGFYNGMGGTGLAINTTLTGGSPTTFWFTYSLIIIYHFAKLYPNNPYLDVENNSVMEWEHSGDFNLVNNKTKDFSSSITNYLSSCTADANGNCSIPFVFGSRTTGILQYSDIKIDYADIVNPIATLTPSVNTQLSLGQSVTLTCSGTDLVGMKSVVMTVDGADFCSGVSSCSESYRMENTNSKIVICTATDTSDNGDSKQIVLSVLEAGGGGGGGGGSGGAPSTPITPAEPVTPPTGEVTPPSSISTEVIGDVSEDTGIEVTDPGEDFTIIDIPQSEITSTIVDNNIIISLGNMADIVYSYVKLDGKPRVDIKFNQVDLKYVGELVNIKYFDIFELAIKILTGMIFTLMIFSMFRIRRV